MSSKPPERVALAVSKYQIGVISWPAGRPLLLTSGEDNENAVLVYRQLSIQGEDWQPITERQIESDLNEHLPEKEGGALWKVRDIDLIIVFVSMEALRISKSRSLVAPVEKGLLWEFPISKMLYLTTSSLEFMRLWLKSFNHEYARVISITEDHAPMIMMRLVEEFIGKGEIEDR